MPCQSQCWERTYTCKPQTHIHVQRIWDILYIPSPLFYCLHFFHLSLSLTNTGRKEEKERGMWRGRNRAPKGRGSGSISVPLPDGREQANPVLPSFPCPPSPLPPFPRSSHSRRSITPSIRHQRRDVTPPLPLDTRSS